MDRRCEYPGCERHASHSRMCAMHSARKLKGIPMHAIPQREYERPGDCIMSGCATVRFAKGLCKRHYQLSFKDGRLDDPSRTRERQQGKVCSVEGCGRPAYAKGHCDMHRRRVLAGRPLDAPIRPARAPCSVEGCGKLEHARGLCDTHYMRDLRSRKRATRTP